MDPGKSLDYPDPGSGTGPETGSKWQCLDGHAAQRAGVQVPSYAAVSRQTVTCRDLVVVVGQRPGTSLVASVSCFNMSLV